MNWNKIKPFFHYPVRVACLVFSVTGPVAGATDDFILVEAAEGVYVHPGRHVSIDVEGHDDIANIGFVVGDDCIAVIDTGGSVNVGERLLSAIRGISDKPICYVINTHIHYDHILGNSVFVREKPVFVGHQNLAEAVEQNREFFLREFRDNLAVTPEHPAVIAPTFLVAKSQNIDLGNRNLHLIAYPVSHSHNDLVVIDDKTRTLWSGDLIFRARVPSLTGNLKGWIDTMEKLSRLRVNSVIPGHGAIADSFEIAIRQQRDYLTTLLEETRKAIAAGQFLNEAVENIDRHNRSNWLLYEHQHPANVERAFMELEWE